MRTHKTLVGPALVTLLLAVCTPPGALMGGSFIFAGEANGVDLILHPQGYTGSQNALTVEICVDPTSSLPNNATSLNDVDNALRNNAAIWNQLQPIVGNSLLSTANNVPSGQIDFESVALHEIGHCIGLAHVNAASESGLSGNDANYTKATEGVNNMWDIDFGADGVRGTHDDVRGDDVNLHWFRMDSNDPGQLPLPVPVDASTYDRDHTSFPAGHLFAQNLDRTAAAVMGHPSAFPINTEAVMQQGSFSDEDQRRTTPDGVGAILLAASGADETAGTADDYVVTVTYGGVSSAGSCDVSIRFEPSASVGLAYCSVGGAFIASPPGTTHARITSALMRFGIEFNWYFNDEAPCRQTLDLVTGQWKQVALSCDPGAADTVADVFGDDLTGVYGTNWIVYERDASIPAYVPLELTDPLDVGHGYWIKTNQATQTIHMEGQFNGSDDTALVGVATGRQNMVGHRYWYDQAWSDVRIWNGASELTLAQADPAGACQGPDPVGNGCLLSRIAHKWNGAAYEPFDGLTPGMEGTLENFDGLWVEAFATGISLRIPDQRSMPASPNTEQTGVPVAPRKDGFARPSLTAPGGDLREVSSGWYVRLIAESGDLLDPGNVLGELPDSSNDYDAHDLIELAPFGDDYLTIVFPHTDWGKKAGSYASDYRESGSRRTQAWHFQVHASDPGAEVVLRWEGPGEYLGRSVLLDIDGYDQVHPEPDGSYTFTMDGPVRNLAWVYR